MNAGAKIGLGVAGGYVLGRRRKARLALGLGAYLLGKRMNLSPAQLAVSGTQALKGMPEFAELGNTVRGELMTAGRRAAAAAMTQRLESIADTLSDRTEGLEGGGRKTAGKASKSGRKQAHRVIDLTAAESGDAYPDDPEESSGRGKSRSRTRETARARGRSTRRRRGDSDTDDEESDAGSLDEAEDYDDAYPDEPEDVEDEYDDEEDDEPEDVEDEYDDEEDDEPEDVEDEYDDEEDDEPEDVEDEYDDEDEDEDDTEDRRSPARASGRSRRRQLARR